MHSITFPVDIVSSASNISLMRITESHENVNLVVQKMVMAFLFLVSMSRCFQIVTYRTPVKIKPVFISFLNHILSSTGHFYCLAAKQHQLLLWLNQSTWKEPVTNLTVGKKPACSHTLQEIALKHRNLIPPNNAREENNQAKHTSKEAE